jgi:hypothetical protein
MFYEVARAIVQRIMRDKILLGLVVIGFLAIFVGGMGSKDEPALATRGGADPASGQQTPAQGLDPKLATDFVKWWLQGAFDFNPSTAIPSHQEALGYMTEQAMGPFQATFWTPQMAQGVTSGQIVGAFHPVSVQAEAINPDGTVVVGVSGTLVMQAGGQPQTQQLDAEFLVVKYPDCLRVAGMYNKLQPAVASSQMTQEQPAAFQGY